MNEPVSDRASTIPVKRPFLPAVQLLRTVGILFVVGAHCWPGLPWSETERNFVPIFFRNITVILVFISGFIFQYKLYRFEYSSSSLRKIKNIGLPYLFMSIPILVVIIFFQKREDVWPWLYELPVYQQVIVFLVTGKHMAHFWYIPVAIILISFSFIFKKIDDLNLYWLAIPVATVASVIMGRDGLYGMYAIIGKAIFVLPSYLIGMAFSRNYVLYLDWYKKNIYIHIIPIVVISIFAYKNITFDLHFLWVQKILFAMILLVVFSDFKPSKIGYILYNKISDFALAIYFMHGYVIDTFRFFVDESKIYFLLHGSSLVKFSFLMIKMVAITAISMAIIWIAQKIMGKYSRLAVGA